MSEVEIRCPTEGCNALFGKIDEGVLVLKNRDLLRLFEGGRAWGPCRKCGKVMEWRSDDDSGPR